LQIGAHVDQGDPLIEAASRRADIVQFFLGDPQGWKGPVVAHPDGAQGLREGSGNIDPEEILAVVAGAGAPVVCETPGGVEGQGGDIAWLRERLPA
jgi:hypothetical protein